MAPRAKPTEAQTIVIADIDRGRGFAIRVALSEYSGARFCDVRKIQPVEGGKPIYSKAGCNVRVDQIETLIHQLQRAREQAVKLGWVVDATPREGG